MPGIPVFCVADNNCLYAGGGFDEQLLKIQQDAKSQKTKQPDKRWAKLHFTGTDIWYFDQIVDENIKSWYNCR